MAPPDKVNPIPPWVLRRPAPAVRPHHNHAPSEQRHARGASGSDNGTVVSDPNSHATGAGSGAGSGTSQAPPQSQGSSTPTNHTGASGTTASTAASKTSKTSKKDRKAKKTVPAKRVPGQEELPMGVDGYLEPSRPLTERDPPSLHGIRHRMSHLFMSSEGRRWDHLRSAEPVIIPRGRPHPPSPPSAGVGGVGGVGGGVGVGAHDTDLDIDLEAQLDGTSSNRHASRPRTRQKQQQQQQQQQHAWWYNESSQWSEFVQSSRYPHDRVLDAEKAAAGRSSEETAALQALVVNDDFGRHTTMRPRSGGGDGGGGVGHFHHKHHVPADLADKPLYKRIWSAALHHPLGPLACRLTVLMTSIVALALAATIYRRERLGAVNSMAPGRDINYDMWLADRHQERTQVIVAIVIDVVAIPYIGYITADDYTGKPLGLRRPQERIRLILTDMFFIIFKSASTALGFEAMIFFTSEVSDDLLRALGAFELIGLISWTMTLTINIFREIERLGGGKTAS